MSKTKLINKFMSKFNFFVFVVSVLCLQVGNTFCSMSGNVVKLNSEKNLLANGDFKAKEEIIFTCGESFVGNGKLDAPVITITAKKFEFTGTIKCGVKCVIMTQEKFDQKMFKREGGGEFVINGDLGKASESIEAGQRVQDFTEKEKVCNENVGACEQKKEEIGDTVVFAQKQDQPLVVPVELNICGITFVFKKKVAIDILDAIKNDNMQMLMAIIGDNPELKQDEYALSNFMMVAGYYNRMDMVKEFISLGANVNSDKITRGGERPILFAIILKNPEFVKVLLQSGANPKVGGIFFSTSPLITAVCEKNVDCLSALLTSKNVDINEKDLESGLTALMIAALLESKAMVEVLLNAGADKNIRDRNFATAADYALAKGFMEIADLIKNFSRSAVSEVRVVLSEPVGVSSEVQEKVSEIKSLASEKIVGESEIKSIASETKISESGAKNISSEKIVSESSAKEFVENTGVCAQKEKPKSWLSYVTVNNCLKAIPVVILGYLLVREIVEKIRGVSRQVDCGLEIVN